MVVPCGKRKTAPAVAVDIQRMGKVKGGGLSGLSESGQLELLEMLE